MRSFHWFHHTENDVLLHQLPAQRWQVYRPTRQRGRRPANRVFHRTHTVLNTLPLHSSPAPIIHTAPHLVQLIGATRPIVTEQDIPHQSFLPFVHHTSPTLAWALQSVTGVENIPHIAHSIRQGNCALISDGSFNPHTSQASSGWYIGNEAFHRLLSGTSPCTGPSEAQSAYRGELAGLYGGLFLVKKLCEFEDIQNGYILVGCDGLGALKQIQRTETPLSSKHFDYVSAIRGLVQDLPIQCQFTHVSGHLDLTHFELRKHIRSPSPLNTHYDKHLHQPTSASNSSTLHTTSPSPYANVLSLAQTSVFSAATNGVSRLRSALSKT